MSDWLCDALGWFCADHGEYVTHGAPEIDGTLLWLVVAIVAGGVAIIQRRGRCG